MIYDEFRGRVIDVDSHEMIPASLWHDYYGDSVDEFLPVFHRIMGALGEGAFNRPPEEDADDVAITDDTVWEMKGPKAPAAIDVAGRRLEVLDRMGVHAQLVFPGAIGTMGMIIGSGNEETFFEQLRVPADGLDLRKMATDLCRANNTWAIENASVDRDRVVPVATVLTFDRDQMMAEARRVIDGGVSCVWIMGSVPPGGVSPAHTDNDPFWDLFAQAGVTVVLHVGGEFDFFKTRAWRQVPQFDPDEKSGLEAPLDPYTMSTFHMASENFLVTMLLGGVFERHPALKFGVIECHAQWVGPMAESTDHWASKFPYRLKLPMKPSEYLTRNVRVAALAHERVDRYIDRYGLEDVYCFSTDYPHVEGGRHAHRTFSERVERLGPSVAEKFFVTNGQLLLPGGAVAA